MAPWNHEANHIAEFDRSGKITSFRTSYDLVHEKLMSMDMRREFDRVEEKTDPLYQVYWGGGKVLSDN